MSGDVHSESAEQPMGDDVFDESFWTDAASDVDPTGANIFTAEIENVNSTDWEVDPDVIWGDGPDAASDVGGGSMGPDLLA